MAMANYGYSITSFEFDNLDSKVEDNFRNVKLWLLIPPFLLLFSFFTYFMFSKGTNFVDKYVGCQKDLFLLLNEKLSLYPNFEFNITQLGDAQIIYPFIFVSIFYTPKLWQALLTSSIIALVVSAISKSIFAIPRPAAMLDNHTFVIVGKRIKGLTSLPSGHSITAIMITTILLFAFMPQKTFKKAIWYILLPAIGFIVAFSRVGIGAHYPLDVIIGMTIGFSAAIIGIKVNTNLSWLNWIKNKRFYPFFILLLLIWSVLIVKKIIALNLPIFYLSLMCLAATLFIISNAYVKKN